MITGTIMISMRFPEADRPYPSPEDLALQSAANIIRQKFNREAYFENRSFLPELEPHISVLTAPESESELGMQALGASPTFKSVLQKAAFDFLTNKNNDLGLIAIRMDGKFLGGYATPTASGKELFTRALTNAVAMSDISTYPINQNESVEWIEFTKHDSGQIRTEICQARTLPQTSFNKANRIVFSGLIDDDGYVDPQSTKFAIMIGLKQPGWFQACIYLNKYT